MRCAHSADLRVPAASSRPDAGAVLDALLDSDLDDAEAASLFGRAHGEHERIARILERVLVREPDDPERLEASLIGFMIAPGSEYAPEILATRIRRAGSGFGARAEKFASLVEDGVRPEDAAFEVTGDLRRSIP